jgi:hypothetical protein
VITQSASSYLDLQAFEDVYFYVDVREATSPPAIVFQTSPSLDDGSFIALAPTLTLAVTTTPVVTAVRAAYAGVPLARFVRWQFVAGSTPWDVVFRIWVMAYGLRS